MDDAWARKLGFLATVSHEIRNPLNVIIGISRLLRHPATEEERQEYLDGLSQTSESLLELVNNIMDFSKLEAGKLILNSRPTNLRKNLMESMTSQRAIAGAKGVDFQVEIDEILPSWLLLDPVKINQVLLNLVSNAVKFTHEGKVVVAVRVEELSPEKATVNFTVRDTGIGIPKEKLKVIFEAFDQGGENINFEFGGTGLGLSISKRVVDLYGGELEVQSETGKGSEFRFVLELEIEQEPAKDPEPAIQPDPLPLLTENLKVLVVDDNKLNLLVVCKNLDLWGIKYKTASTGLGAVRKVQEEVFNLILMDLHMPGMDGLEAAGVIRNIEGCREMPIIGLTASTDKKFRIGIEAAGFSDLLAKPFRPEELLESIILHTKTRTASLVL